MSWYHVSKLKNLKSIVDGGLSSAKEKNYINTGKGIYLFEASSLESAVELGFDMAEYLNLDGFSEFVLVEVAVSESALLADEDSVDCEFGDLIPDIDDEDAEWLSEFGDDQPVDDADVAKGKVAIIDKYQIGPIGNYAFSRGGTRTARFPGSNLAAKHIYVVKGSGDEIEEIK